MYEKNLNYELKKKGADISIVPTFIIVISRFRNMKQIIIIIVFLVNNFTAFRFK